LPFTGAFVAGFVTLTGALTGALTIGFGATFTGVLAGGATGEATGFADFTGVLAGGATGEATGFVDFTGGTTLLAVFAGATDLTELAATDFVADAATEELDLGGGVQDDVALALVDLVALPLIPRTRRSRTQSRMRPNKVVLRLKSEGPKLQKTVPAGVPGATNPGSLGANAFAVAMTLATLVLYRPWNPAWKPLPAPTAVSSALLMVCATPVPGYVLPLAVTFSR